MTGLTEGKSHFLELTDAGGKAIATLLNEAIARKKRRTALPRGTVDPDMPLAGHVLAMVFEKNSTRTRVSFDIAMRQLGGSAIVLDGGTTQLGRGESVADTARVLSRMVDAIMVRTDDHEKIEQMAQYASVPVINGLTDQSHPCQIVADLLTVIEHGKALPGLEMAWFGDCNNVLNSLIEAAGLMKFNIRIGTPQDIMPDERYVAAASANGAKVTVMHDASEAAAGADILVTDTWFSMGQEQDQRKLERLTPFQVNASLMGLAKADAKFLHCLPAHVGEEVTEDVFEGEQSVVFDEAENRIHAQKSILQWCLGKLG